MGFFKTGVVLNLTPSIFSTAFLFSVLVPQHAAASGPASIVAECGAIHESLTFDIVRKKKTIGVQTVEVYDCDGTPTALIDVDISFRMALLRVKAKQTIVEQWRDGAMVSFYSERTASFSEDTTIDAKRVDGVWGIHTNGVLVTSQAQLASSAYWTADLVHAEAVLNIDTGELIPIADRDRRDDFYELQRSDGKTLQVVVAGDRVVSATLISAGEAEISFIRTDM